MNYFTPDDYDTLCGFLNDMDPDLVETFAGFFTVNSDGNYVLTNQSDYEDWLETLFQDEWDPNTNEFMVFSGYISGTSTQGGGVL